MPAGFWSLAGRRTASDLPVFTLTDSLAGFTPEPLDTSRHFVRVRAQRAPGMIEFEFAIGDPKIFVELVMPRQAFAEFCATNRVEVLNPLDPDVAPGDWDWRLHNATHTRFK